MKKTPSSGKSVISTYSIFGGWGGVGRLFEFEWEWEGSGVGGRLFEAGRLLTFSAFRMGAYSRWALIRGWALIRINTVIKEEKYVKTDISSYLPIIQKIFCSF